MIAVPFGPLLAWKRGDLLGAAQRLTAAASGADCDRGAMGVDPRRQRFARSRSVLPYLSSRAR